MSARRLKQFGRVDRSQVLHFRFDGKAYTGFHGDTLASALLANGVRVVARSFKYHRPRGVCNAWFDEPNAIVSIRLNNQEMPNCLATTTYLENGMDVRAVNAWPSAQNDLKGVLDFAHPLWSAGFYYKTFMWPNWHLFEPIIRRLAGLGTVSPDQYDDYVSDQRFATCDSLVVGGGAAGIAAARAAAEAGEDVVLVDDHRELGGGLFQETMVEGYKPEEWIASEIAAFEAAGGRVLTHTTAFGVFDHKMVGLVQNTSFGVAPRFWRMRTKRIILAAGAVDRSMTFANNDSPGVMSLLAANEFLARYGVLVGSNAIALSNNSAANAAANNLEAAGININRIDAQDAQLTAIGGKRLKGLSVNGKMHDADTVLVSAGFTPLVHLWRHAGGKLHWCDQRQAFVPSTAPDGMQAIGAANGDFDLEPALEYARAMGASKVANGVAGDTTSQSLSPYKVVPHWPTPGSKGRQWIDLQHDVTLKDIELAASENYVSVEHLKRYTTLGMASDQGKSSNMVGLAAMAAIQGRSIPEVGTTTFRPPFVPIPIETYHGQHGKTHWRPVKRLPLEVEHRTLNAALCEYGGWLRPGWYGEGDAQACIHHEALTVRNVAGIFDGSPLGKIEVMGPDAEAFVNFVCYNTISTLKTGKIRYWFMLTEAGVVMDDGVISRLGSNRFLISCSSSHVDSVRSHLESWRQDGNDPDRIFVHDLTMNYATVTVTGPQARSILTALDLGVDLSSEAYSHMSFVDGKLGNEPVRIARVSFTGEASYEISIRTRCASNLWQAAMKASSAIGAVPVGIEAMSILRAEKGYLMIGKDTDGETMPHDLGFGIPRKNKRGAFIGDRSLRNAKANGTQRKSLVGLMLSSGDAPLETGAHVITSDDTNKRSLGYVTSSYYSPYLGHPIALGMVEGGAQRVGDTVQVWHQNESRQATLCSPCFFDPDGERLHA